MKITKYMSYTMSTFSIVRQHRIVYFRNKILDANLIPTDNAYWTFFQKPKAGKTFHWYRTGPGIRHVWHINSVCLPESVHCENSMFFARIYSYGLEIESFKCDGKSRVMCGYWIFVFTSRWCTSITDCQYFRLLHSAIYVAFVYETMQ